MSELIERCFKEISNFKGFPAEGTPEFKLRKKNFIKDCKFLLKEQAAEEEEEEPKKKKKKATQRKKDEAEAGEPVSKKRVKIGGEDKPKKKSATKKSK